MNTFLLLISIALASTACASYFDEEPDFMHKNYRRGPPEKTHLVTMRRAELLGTVNCVSDGKHKLLRHLL